MAKTSGALVAQRRQEVADLWLHGVPVSQISRHLNVPERTVWRDIATIRTELAEASRATLEQRRARSLAVLREVQLKAWALFADASLNPNSTNRVGALNTVLATETAIAKLEGTWRVDAQMRETQESVQPSYRAVVIMPEQLPVVEPPNLLRQPQVDITVAESGDPLGWPDPGPIAELDEF